MALAFNDRGQEQLLPVSRIALRDGRLLDVEVRPQAVEALSHLHLVVGDQLNLSPAPVEPSRGTVFVVEESVKRGSRNVTVHLESVDGCDGRILAKRLSTGSKYTVIQGNKSEFTVHRHISLEGGHLLKLHFAHGAQLLKLKLEPGTSVSIKEKPCGIEEWEVVEVHTQDLERCPNCRTGLKGPRPTEFNSKDLCMPGTQYVVVKPRTQHPNGLVLYAEADISGNTTLGLVSRRRNHLHLDQQVFTGCKKQSRSGSRGVRLRLQPRRSCSRSRPRLRSRSARAGGGDGRRCASAAPPRLRSRPRSRSLRQGEANGGPVLIRRRDARSAREDAPAFPSRHARDSAAVTPPRSPRRSETGNGGGRHQHSADGSRLRSRSPRHGKHAPPAPPRGSVGLVSRGGSGGDDLASSGRSNGQMDGEAGRPWRSRTPNCLSGAVRRPSLRRPSPLRLSGRRHSPHRASPRRSSPRLGGASPLRRASPASCLRSSPPRLRCSRSPVAMPPPPRRGRSVSYRISSPPPRPTLAGPPAKDCNSAPQRPQRAQSLAPRSRGLGGFVSAPQPPSAQRRFDSRSPPTVSAPSPSVFLGNRGFGGDHNPVVFDNDRLARLRSSVASKVAAGAVDPKIRAPPIGSRGFNWNEVGDAFASTEAKASASGRGGSRLGETRHFQRSPPREVSEAHCGTKGDRVSVSEWEECFNEEGKVFFHHVQSGRTQWERPYQNGTAAEEPTRFKPTSIPRSRVAGFGGRVSVGGSGSGSGGDHDRTALENGTAAAKPTQFAGYRSNVSVGGSGSGVSGDHDRTALEALQRRAASLGISVGNSI